MKDRVPVLVLGGFLGSGKTTVVRHLLAEAQRTGQRLAVVSNEFGALGIDAALIGDRPDQMVELSGGCVCCTLSNELRDTLQLLREKADPDCIVVECSGLALPFDTQLHLYRPPLRDWVGDEACVVVVDAERTDEADALFAEQIQSADLLILSKVDLVSPAQLASARARLAELAPDTAVVEAVQGMIPLAVVWPTAPRAEAPVDGHDHDHDHAPHSHAAWASHELHVPDGMAEAAAYDWIYARRGVRTKGFVRCAEGPRVVQGVGRRLELVPPGPGGVPEALLGRVVVIDRPPA
jgi:cobalamin biosynthesis protein CobW